MRRRALTRMAQMVVLHQVAVIARDIMAQGRRRRGKLRAGGGRWWRLLMVMLWLLQILLLLLLWLIVWLGQVGCRASWAGAVAGPVKLAVRALHHAGIWYDRGSPVLAVGRAVQITTAATATAGYAARPLRVTAVDGGVHPRGIRVLVVQVGMVVVGRRGGGMVERRWGTAVGADKGRVFRLGPGRDVVAGAVAVIVLAEAVAVGEMVVVTGGHHHPGMVAGGAGAVEVDVVPTAEANVSQGSSGRGRAGRRGHGARRDQHKITYGARSRKWKNFLQKICKIVGFELQIEKRVASEWMNWKKWDGEMRARKRSDIKE